MKALLVAAITSAALVSGSVFAAQPHTAGTYQVDPAHSKVGFEVTHLVVSSVEGRFNDYQGELKLGEKIEDSKVNMSIKTASIDTGIKKRDDHLRSADFFDAKKYPTITFKSKKVKADGDDLKITGDMTMKGITKEVTFDAKYLGSVKDGYGNYKAAFQASTKINRKDFGLTWSSMVEAGPAVGDDVTLSLKIQAAKKEK